MRLTAYDRCTILPTIHISSSLLFAFSGADALTVARSSHTAEQGGLVARYSPLRSNASSVLDTRGLRSEAVNVALCTVTEQTGILVLNERC